MKKNNFALYNGWVINHTKKGWIATRVECLRAEDLQALQIKIDEYHTLNET